MENLSKEELVGDLLMNGHIDGEEAIALLKDNVYSKTRRQNVITNVEGNGGVYTQNNT